MKKAVVFLFVLLVSISSRAGNLTALFSYSAFDVPGGSPHIETYLRVIGSTVNLVDEGEMRKGQIEVKWILRSGDQIVHIDKYNLNSPLIPTGEKNIPDFIDQQRITLEAGEYRLELGIRDKNSDALETMIRDTIRIGFPVDTISVSDIEFLESYTKSDDQGKFSRNGFTLIPMVSDFYSREVSTFKFYAEIYRSDIAPASDYLVLYHISSKDNKKVMENYVGSIKHSPRSVNPLIGEFNIADLSSGNYYLNIEVRDRQNRLIAYKQEFFQRSNEQSKPLVSDDYTTIDITNTFISQQNNPDTLSEFLACLNPISSEIEVNAADNLIVMRDVGDMQRFMYYFWSKRNAADPGQAWADYFQQVRMTVGAFSTPNKKGYDSDRGKVYLKYGPPNVITEVKDDPVAYPYEIWHYYKLANQSNRKFVFYTTDLSTNDYVLLHSDAIGELKNPSWELFLHKRTQQFGNDLDQENSIDIYGGRTKENFSNPK